MTLNRYINGSLLFFVISLLSFAFGIYCIAEYNRLAVLLISIASCVIFGVVTLFRIDDLSCLDIYMFNFRKEILPNFIIFAKRASKNGVFEPHVYDISIDGVSARVAPRDTRIRDRIVITDRNLFNLLKENNKNIVLCTDILVIYHDNISELHENFIPATLTIKTCDTAFFAKLKMMV